MDRLGQEFAQAIARLNIPQGSSRSLARATGADVALCHRVMMGIRATGGLGERVATWPGVTGATHVAEKVCVALGKENLSGSLALAVNAYAEVVRSLAGTQARLARMLRAAEGAASADAEMHDQVPARRSISRGAAELVGYSSDLATFIGAMRPIPGSPELIEGCSAWGLIGLACQTRSAVIASQNIQMRQVAGDLATEVRWTPLGHSLNGRDGLLTEFSSAPAPLTATDGSDGIIRQMVDLTKAQQLGKVDIVLARHWSPDANPQQTPTPSWSQVFRMRHPVRSMLMDVYMHRSMLTGSPPAIGAYHWHPGLASDPRNQWHDRLPGNPRIELLSGGPLLSRTDVWRRQHELATTLFGLLGWPAEEFVGFRCHEPYPTWGAAYYMTFDLKPA